MTKDVPKGKAELEKKKKEKFDAIVVDQYLLYSHLWKINVESKDKKRLTEGDFTVSTPRWSPDGRWIAYVMSRSGSQESAYTDISADRNTDIYIISSDGGTPRQLTTNPAADASPEWSPDGREIAYIANSEPKSWAAKNDLMVVILLEKGARIV